MEILLGMMIRQHPCTKAITISQKAYFEQMLEHFGLQSPLQEEEHLFMADKLYQPIVGSILWGQVCMHPDLAFAGSLLAHYQLKPG